MGDNGSERGGSRVLWREHRLFVFQDKVEMRAHSRASMPNVDILEGQELFSDRHSGRELIKAGPQCGYLSRIGGGINLHNAMQFGLMQS